jgi:hypothetical protein
MFTLRFSFLLSWHRDTALTTLCPLRDDTFAFDERHDHTLTTTATLYGCSGRIPYGLDGFRFNDMLDVHSMGG